MQLRGKQQRFEQFGARIVVITFEPPEVAAPLMRTLGAPFPLLCDPAKAAYAAFGLGAGEHASLWSWKTGRAYLKGMAQGQLPRRPRGDTDQLGGDFVLDARGRLVAAFRGDGPADRPSVEDLLAAVQAATAGHE